MKVIISAGGTGGHIYPAISIIKKILELEPNSEILYIGTHNRMEKDIVPKFNIKYEAIEIYGFSKTNIKRDIKNISLIRKAIKRTKKIIMDFKPNIVIGVGGYVTFPVIYAAHKLKIKTLIHEQNSIPGKSNKMLSKFADAICVSFEDSIKYFDKNKTYFTGNPCSENALETKLVSKEIYKIKNNRKTVLIVQGSLGSNVINNKMKDFLSNIENEIYDVIYVTGNNFYDEYKVNKFSKNVHIVPFVENMSGLLKNIDVIVTRAGASSLSEIIALKIPNIIIPSPYVANNHQYFNALSIINNKSGFMIQEKDLTKDLLKEYINKCLDKKTIIELKKNMEKLYIKDSSTQIVNIIKGLIK